MKLKLKVKRIVDHYFSKDDVGFYKIEWEESWLPVDAFQHLKYLMEEFWAHNKEIEESSENDKNKETFENNEDHGSDNAVSDNLKTQLTLESGELISEHQLGSCLPSKNKNTLVGEETTSETACYFCGCRLNPDELNKHEHGHIGGNCSDVLISWIENSGGHDKVVLVNLEDHSLGNRTFDGSEKSADVDHLPISLGRWAYSNNITLPNVVSPLPCVAPSIMSPADPCNTSVVFSSVVDEKVPEATTSLSTSATEVENETLLCPTSVYSESAAVYSESAAVYSESTTVYSERAAFHSESVDQHDNPEDPGDPEDAPNYHFCHECGKHFVSKVLFVKHKLLHREAKRLQKSYGDKLTSLKPGRRALRRLLIPKLFPSLSGGVDNFAHGKDYIDLSKSPFGSSRPNGPGSPSLSQADSLSTQNNQMFLEMLENNRYQKRSRKENAEFSPDVLRSARQYIKAVSKRRKNIKRSRLKAGLEEKLKSGRSGDVVDGIGVDVELERSESSFPDITVVDGRRAYGCKICGKSFFNKFHHREHYNVHSGEMPYECEFCLKRFAQRSGWNRHIKLHHKYDVFTGPIPRFVSPDKHNKYDSLTASIPHVSPDEQDISDTKSTSSDPLLPELSPRPSFVVPPTSIISQNPKVLLPTTTSVEVVPPPLVVPSPKLLTTLPSFVCPQPGLVGSNTVLLPHPTVIGSHQAIVIPSNARIISISKQTVPDSCPSTLVPSPVNANPSVPRIISVSTQTVTGPCPPSGLVVSPLHASLPKQLSTKPTSSSSPSTCQLVTTTSCVTTSSTLVGATKKEYCFHTYKPKDEAKKHASLIETPVTFSVVTPDSRVTSEETKLTQIQPSYKVQFDGPGMCNLPPLSLEETCNAQPQLLSLQQNEKTEDSTVTVEGSSVVRIAPKKEPSGTPVKVTAFQCKKVRTINRDLIFMIRVSDKTSSGHAPNKEFAYILDEAGFVESRIFVDDYPGGDWLDFPLDETAADVLLNRVHEYDDHNRRGPKPAHLTSNRKQLLKTVDKAKDSVIYPVHDVKAIRAKPLSISTKETTPSPVVYLTPPGVSSDGAATLAKPTHGRSFRSGREKKFSCSICERKFLAQAHLNDHMLIHTGELPYKCMFCNRPFRHKSGLNSHHKRHIQRGVFNRPISSKDKSLPTDDKPDELSDPAQILSSNFQTGLLSSQPPPPPTEVGQVQYSNVSFSAGSQLKLPLLSNDEGQSTLAKVNLPGKDPPEKARRKGRKPKQVRKSPVETYFNGDGYATLPGTYIGETGDVKNENDGSLFECNFCTLKFPIRTAYLKHVNSVHKASQDHLDEIEMEGLDMFSDENLFTDEFPETFIKEETPCVEAGEMNGGVDCLFPEITVKEEEIDDRYLQ